MSKWLSVELSLLLLVSLVALGGLVGTSFGNDNFVLSDNSLSGEAVKGPSCGQLGGTACLNKKSACPAGTSGIQSTYDCKYMCCKPIAKPTQPVTSTICPPQYEVELAAGRIVPASGTVPGFLTKPGLAEGDIVYYSYYSGADKRDVKIEVLAINVIKKEVAVNINGQKFIVPLENGARVKMLNIKNNQYFDVLVTLVDIMQGTTNFVQLAVSDIFSIRYGIIKQIVAADIHLVLANPNQVFVSADNEIVLSNLNIQKAFKQNILPRESTKAGNIITVLGIRQI